MGADSPKDAKKQLRINAFCLRSTQCQNNLFSLKVYRNFAKYLLKNLGDFRPLLQYVGKCGREPTNTGEKRRESEEMGGGSPPPSSIDGDDSLTFFGGKATCVHEEEEEDEEVRRRK